MAKPLKIEQLKLQGVVAAGLREGLNPQQIAEACSKEAKQPISNMAVRRYLEATEGVVSGIPASYQAPPKQVKAVVTSSPDRIQRLVDRDIDLIELQYRTTLVLAERFDWITALPDLFESRLQQLSNAVRGEGTDTTTLDHWGLGFALELRRNIGNMAALNREIRANSQFMATLREKAFEFNLIQEYLENALEEIRNVVGPEAFDMASERLITNPRLQRIVDQITRLGGGDVE
ncbi:hypothetical protein [Paenibacillus albus]|uniref:Uncharacterized protein n=1 Tax=Paenibacillus albus TaxID=2495582 RepID=A0A3Q8XAW6_9BACL|nr:hypothetical protein [Paenibacillus albus]AZN43367.1 hypothetical protein EJC50_29500 [Paenibacillus albus]